MLDLITKYFADHPAELITQDLPLEAEAAVLIALTRNVRDPSVILTQRAEHLNSHRGEVAFPGGKRDSTDRDLLFTALRETHEEINVPPEQIEIVGEMPVRATRFHISVAPFVGIVDQEVKLRANPDELDAVFQVPASYFLNRRNLTSDLFVGPGYSLQMPCYIFEGYRIWGFYPCAAGGLPERCVRFGH